MIFDFCVLELKLIRRDEKKTAINIMKKKELMNFCKEKDARFESTI